MLAAARTASISAGGAPLITSMRSSSMKVTSPPSTCNMIAASMHSARQARTYGSAASPTPRLEVAPNCLTHGAASTAAVSSATIASAALPHWDAAVNAATFGSADPDAEALAAHVRLEPPQRVHAAFYPERGCYSSVDPNALVCASPPVSTPADTT